MRDDFGAVMLATCLSSALATFLMGVMANYPIALAPVMGHNFFFVFTVCLAMGIPWQKALGAVFISGVLFLILSFFGMRERIVDAVPQSLKSGVAIIVALKLLKIRGSILLGIISAALLGLHLKVVKFYGIAQRPPSISTLIGVSEEGGFMKNGKLPRAKEALLSDALGTVGGAMLGTSTITSYMSSVHNSLVIETVSQLLTIIPYVSRRYGIIFSSVNKRRLYGISLR